MTSGSDAISRVDYEIELHFSQFHTWFLTRARAILEKNHKKEVKEVWNNHEMNTRNKSQNHSSSASNMFAFVYGTLKRGEPNHHWLTGTDNGSATFVGTGVTQNKFPLVIASCYNIPFLIDQSGTGKV